MRFKRKFATLTMTLALSAGLTACGTNDNTMNDMPDESMGEMDHGNMDMSGSREVPTGLQEAENPTFDVGDQAVITEAHMPGMEGAEATIVGAYDTVVYSISYDPMHGGERVRDHKWIIHEEIVDAKAGAYEPGDEVTVDAEHMSGMGGATATIDSAEETTVYMVDFELDNGERVTNHKWVTEDELSAN